MKLLIYISVFLCISLSWMACHSAKPITESREHYVEFPPKDSIAQKLYTDSIFMAAEAAKQTGDIKTAVNNFSLFLHYQPDNPTVDFELSRLFAQMQNVNYALLFARKAARDSSNIWFQLNYADALALNKQYEEAADVFAGLSRHHPGNPDYFYNEGVLLTNAGKYEEAMQIFDSIEKKSGITEDAVYQKQRIFLKEGNITAAANEIKKLITRYPDDGRYYALLAEIYDQHNMPDSALEVYKNLLQKEPDNPQALIAIALNYKRKGDESTYYQYMAKAFANPNLNIDDKINFIYPFLKYVQIDSSQKQEALTLCRMVLQAHPDDARAYALYADMYFQCGQTDSALIQYYKATELDHSNIDVWQQIMRIYSAEEKNDSLLSVSRQVMQLFPDNYLGYYFNGAANALTGNDAQGIISLREALSAGVNDRNIKSEIYSLLGEAYNNMHNYAASDSCFDTALFLVPDNDEVLNNYSYYLAVRGEHLDKAARMSKASLQLSPDNYVYEDTYAWVLYKMGKYKEARQWMEKALSHTAAQNGPGYLEHYGDILYKMNKVDEAVKYWKMAREKGASSPGLNRKINEKKLVDSRTTDVSKQ